MDLKTSRPGRSYINLVTKSKLFFPVFILSGIAIILFMTLHTKIDVLKTYEANVLMNESQYIFIFENSTELPYAENIDKFYIYETKNDAVYQIDNGYPVNSATLSAGYSQNDNTGLSDFLFNHIDKKIYIDIPVKQISLLERIFSGGKM